MKLDRNVSRDGKGKYALVKLRGIDSIEDCEETTSFGKLIAYHFDPEVIDFGSTPETEFFVIRLKDKYAAPALSAYATAAWSDDPEYALEIQALAARALNHPLKKQPD